MKTAFPAGTSPEATSLIATAFQNPGADGILIDATHSLPIDASLLRWLMLEAMPAETPDIARLTLNAASITGCLDLAATTLKIIPSLRRCRFLPGSSATDIGINLTDATITGFEILGGDLPTMRANRVNATGSLVMRSGGVDLLALPGTEIPLSIAGGILLSGAHIRGNLDLRGITLGPLPKIDSDTVALLADGAAIEGNLLLSDCTVTGEIRLNGSHLQRNLDCTGARLENLKGYSLSAAGAEIDGSAYFSPSSIGNNAGATSRGELRFDGAHIRGDLDLNGATLTATAFGLEGWTRIKAGPDGENENNDNERETYAFCATGLKVDSSLNFRHRFTANGAISLTSVTIGDDLLADNNAAFNFPGEDAVCLDGATISGVADFSHSSSNGMIRYVQAEIAQGAYFRNFTFKRSGQRHAWSDADPDLTRDYGEDICGLYAASATIGGSFIWKDLNLRPDTDVPPAPARKIIFIVPGAAVTELQDDENSWAAVDRIDLRDADYDRIAELNANSAWRLDLLDREYAPWNNRGWNYARLTWEVVYRTAWRQQHSTDAGSLGEQVRRFSPGPYLQLAKTFREAGLEEAARRVLLRLERNRARYGGLPLIGMLWRGVLDGAIAFGSAPFRPLYLYIPLWTLISACLFQRIYDLNCMHPVENYIHFNAIFYAFDTLIPFVDFDQRKNFVIDPIFSLGGALLLANTLLGYAAASFLAAGLSGLAKLGDDK